MSDLTFEQLPKAVGEIRAKMDTIEQLLHQLLSRADTSNFDEYVTIRQTAEILSLSVPTIYGLVHRRIIPYSKQGKRLYFSRKELNDWIHSGRRQTNTEIQQEARDSMANRKRKW